MSTQSQPGGADAPEQVEQLTELQKNDAILREILDSVTGLSDVLMREFAKTVEGVNNRIEVARRVGVDELTVDRFKTETDALLEQMGNLQRAVNKTLQQIASAEELARELGVEATLNLSGDEVARLTSFDAEIRALVGNLRTSVTGVQSFLSQRERQRAEAKHTGYALNTAGIKAEHLRVPQMPAFEMSEGLKTKYLKLEKVRSVLASGAYETALATLDTQKQQEDAAWREAHSADEKELALLAPVIEALDKGELLGDLFGKPSFDAEGTYTAIANRLRKPALELDGVDNKLLTRLPRVIIEKIVYGMTAEEFWQSMERFTNNSNNSNLPFSYIAVSKEYKERSQRETELMISSLQRIANAVKDLNSKNSANWPGNDEFRDATYIFGALKGALKALDGLRPENQYVKEILSVFADFLTDYDDIMTPINEYLKFPVERIDESELTTKMNVAREKITALIATVRRADQSLSRLCQHLQHSAEAIKRDSNGLQARYDNQSQKEYAEAQKKLRLTGFVENIFEQQRISLTGYRDILVAGRVLEDNLQNYTAGLANWSTDLRNYKLRERAFGRVRNLKSFGLFYKNKIDFTPAERGAAAKLLRCAPQDVNVTPQEWARNCDSLPHSRAALKSAHSKMLREAENFFSTYQTRNVLPGLDSVVDTGLVSLQVVKESVKQHSDYAPTNEEVEAIYNELAPEQKAKLISAKLEYLKAVKEKLAGKLPEIVSKVDKAQAVLDEMGAEAKKLFVESGYQADNFSFAPLKEKFENYLKALDQAIAKLQEQAPQAIAEK